MQIPPKPAKSWRGKTHLSSKKKIIEKACETAKIERFYKALRKSDVCTNKYICGSDLILRLTYLFHLHTLQDLTQLSNHSTCNTCTKITIFEDSEENSLEDSGFADDSGFAKLLLSFRGFGIRDSRSFYIRLEDSGFAKVLLSFRGFDEDSF